MQHSLPPRSPDIIKQRSSTMPVREEISELEVLRQENSEFKSRLVLMQKELSKLDNKVLSLQREKSERSQIEEESSKEQLSQYQVAINLLEKLLTEGEIRKRKFNNHKSYHNKNIVERCNELQHANEQLQQEAQSQRQEYEKCLDNVALQVVQAIIVQKKQQEECERLSKKVKVLQTHNINLSHLLSNKAKSMSPSYAQRANCYDVLSQCSQSLPGTLLGNENKDISKVCCSNDSELSQSSDETSHSKSELTDTTDKCDTACWYDVIKAINSGDTKESEGSSVEPANKNPSTNEPQIPEVQVTSHCPVTLASCPNTYAHSANHRELIVNSVLTCATTGSYLSPNVQQHTDVSTIIGHKPIHKLPPINRKEKNILVDGTTKDEGYSTMSSDVQTEPKVSVSTIATVEEEKLKPADESDLPEPTIQISNQSQAQPEYVDGLRVVYDEEEGNSDVFLIAIRNRKDGDSNVDASRSLSESDLTKTAVIAKSLVRKTTNFDQTSLPPYFSINKKNLINLQMKSLLNCGISKRFRNSRKLESQFENEQENARMGSFPGTNSNSPSAYSHAEMEDWSLELSAEDLSTPANSIISGRSNFPSGEHSLRETSNFDLEDQPEMSWNGVNYSARTLDWQYEKPISKTWLNNNSRSMISPKSGCSDQPAVWSSIEHLSSCSDVASKCSTDIENFCDQLCKLPELKRMSVSSMDNTPDCLTNLIKSNGSLEDNSELNENIAFDNMFTRDFYRLIKFGSTKSLAASSRSLAPSETSCQTLDRLKSRDSSINKTFTSVLGFIAEQQKYCRQRELLDEQSKLDTKANTLDTRKYLNNNEELTDRTFVIGNANLSRNNTTPSQPKRSTSLNLSNGYVRSRGTLPSVPSVPSPPSRTSSRTTLPRHSIHSQHSIASDNFPIPPPSASQETVPEPPVPPHRYLPLPLLPERTSSKHHDSPPVPKRVTSRALPTPPPRPIAAASTLRPSGPPPAVPTTDRQVPPRTTSLTHDKFKRSNSLQAPASHKGNKSRISCGDLVPNCKTSEKLLIHLKKMVQDEDESNNERSSPEHSPRDEVGLGTGWVRVAPLTDLTDSKNRANLLDSMMPSSEAGSSETEDDSVRTRPQEYLLKTAQRNRRKKKVSRHREDCQQLPAHNHFEYEERDALNTFYFLDSLSSSSEELFETQNSSVSKFNKKLDALRSSEFCDTSADFRCQSGEAPSDLNTFEYFVAPPQASPFTTVNLASTKKLSAAVTPARPSSIRSNIFRPSNVRIDTPRPTSMTFSSFRAKQPCGTHRPSSGAFRPLINDPSGSNSNIVLNSINDHRSSTLNDDSAISPHSSSVMNSPKLVTTPPNCSRFSSVPNADLSMESDDLSKIRVFERKNSLVYRIKEAFEKSSVQPMNSNKNGFEKERLKSPNVKAVIEKFSQPNNKLVVSMYAAKSKSNPAHDEPMDATYVINRRGATKEKNLPPKSSPTKVNIYSPNTKTSTGGKSAKIPTLNFHLGKKVSSVCEKGRISISDSCAEAFSPLCSEDEEVFRKSSFH